MNSSTKNWIIAILILIVLTGVFFFGYSRYPIWRPCPVTNSDTVYVYDTIEHHIVDSFPYYVSHTDSIKYKDKHWMDSVILANKVDTNALYNIFQKFYAEYHYTREWNDTLVIITINDVITENKPTHNNFTYKLLKPLTVINNSTTVTNYSKYIYLGGSLSIPDSKYSNVGLYGAFPRTFIGISYIPFNPGAMFTIGVKIVKIK